MKGKIFGVLIALCMVCVFVGCDDPSSEKPGVNYKDSGFVGTWVNYEISTTYGCVMQYTYTLDSTGKGLWTGSVVYGDAVPWDDRNIVWTPLVNGEVHLEYVDWYAGSTIQETGTLSEGGAKLRVGDLVYEKSNENPDAIYIESGYVGTWVYEEGGKAKYIYVLNEEGKGLWAQFELTPMEDVAGFTTVLWVPLETDEIDMTQTIQEGGFNTYTRMGSLSDNNTKLTVGSLVYTKQ